MQERTVTLAMERATKNTVRYEEEETAGQAPVVRTIYIAKWVLGNTPPARVEVTIKAV